MEKSALKEHWKLIYKYAHEPALLVNADKYIESVNKAAVDFFGQDEASLLGALCYQGFDKTQACCKKERCPMQDIKKQNKVTAVQVEAELRDRTCLVSCIPIYNENQELQFVTHLVQDITSQKAIALDLQEKSEEIQAQNEEFVTMNEELREAYEVLKESEEMYHLLVDHMQLGLALHEVICDEQGEVIDYRFLDLNPAYEKLVGFKKKSTIGKTVLEILPDLEREWIEKFGKVALSGEAITYDNYVESLGKHYETIAYCPEPGKFAVLVEDITSRKKTEELIREKSEELEAQNEEYQQINEELYAAKERAEESDRLKSSFLANLSHEIRTPMNGMLGFASLLKISDLTIEKRDEYIDIILKSGNHLLSVITDIIEISKIETKQIKPSFFDVDIGQLLEDLYQTIGITIPEGKDMQLVYTPIEEQLVISTDQAKLLQVLTNLITNAIKFTRHGTVEFGCTKKRNTIQFFVRDTGIGISASNQQIIFDRFRQVEDEHTIKQGGSGLGLAISKAYVEMLGGAIWVESKVGKGSVFYFSIPFTKGKADAKADEERAMSAFQMAKNQKKYILVAEDDQINYLFLSELLESMGYTSKRAENGKIAVEACLKDPAISLVLMDIKMPVMDGYEATRRIKAKKAGLPIVAQTAYALSDDEDKALEAGCDDYITKPIKREELRSILTNFLG